MGECVICEVCQIKFTLFNNLRAHYKNKHPDCSPPTKKTAESSGAAESKCTCSCPLCHSRFSKRKDLISHVGKAHEIDVESETHKFQNFESFLLWKEHVEDSTKSRFIKTRGTRVSKNTETVYFDCCRSGHYKSRGRGIRLMKRKGSRKINDTCPAGIKLKKGSDGKCEVLFTKTHIGHTSDIVHFDLYKKDRASLAKGLSEKRPKIKDTNNDNVIVEGYFFNENGSRPNQDEETLEERKIRLLETVGNMIFSSSNHETLHVIETALELIGPTIKAINSMQPNIIVNNITESIKISPGPSVLAKKKIKQQNLNSTKKKSNLPTKKLERKPCQKDIDNIKLGVLQEESGQNEKQSRVKMCVNHDHDYRIIENPPQA